MNIQLKDFQEVAVRDLLKFAGRAAEDAANGLAQAIIFSSPTGSGKTVAMAAFMEAIVKGHTFFERDPSARFLWISDSPELNVQSADKILWASNAFGLFDVKFIDSEFDQETFSPGALYFVNTSKLGKDKLLTTSGEQRTHTFWQTVASTSALFPRSFYVIIDEAHRGMAQSAQERRRAQSIVQKFILGSDDDFLPPVPLVIGLSATPQRFYELLGQTQRSIHPVTIKPDDVRESGLLKDMILVDVPATTIASDMTLLSEATNRWRLFTTQWKNYCDSQSLPPVHPVLVVQVADGNATTVTRTSLSEAVGVIERIAGELPDEAYAHCFQEDKTLQAGRRLIRKINASGIQADTAIKVVFFKMSLTTGWDCPRAEVMMSFRSAQDHTHIAQLVGRMIRTPLARRIESDDVLNSVELFLPHYDEGTVGTILKELQDPDAGLAIGTGAQQRRSIQALTRVKSLAAEFAHVESLPSYSVHRYPELTPVKRLLRLASRLSVNDELDSAALTDAKDACLRVLVAAAEHTAKTDKRYIDRVRERGHISVTTVSLALRGTSGASEARKVALTPENVEDLFEQCGRGLAPGEGLHKAYWKHRYDAMDPDRAKLELALILEDASIRQSVAKTATEIFTKLYDRNKHAIANLPASTREEYNRIIGASPDPQLIMRTLPGQLLLPKGKRHIGEHMYVDDTNEFWPVLNSWEEQVVEKERASRGFRCWLRNASRKDWAICVPYEFGGIKPFYPDFVIVRRAHGQLLVDLLDPHNKKYDDTWAKLKGLAAFGAKHGQQFGRLEISVVEDGAVRSVNVNDPLARKKALRLKSNNDIDALFT